MSQGFFGLPFPLESQILRCLWSACQISFGLEASKRTRRSYFCLWALVPSRERVVSGGFRAHNRQHLIVARRGRPWTLGFPGDRTVDGVARTARLSKPQGFGEGFQLISHSTLAAVGAGLRCQSQDVALSVEGDPVT